MTSRLRPLAAAALPLATLVLAAGCGSDADTTAADTGPSTSASASPSPAAPTTPAAPSTPASTKPAPPNLPACAKVWVEGKRLPGGYKGCLKNGKKDHSLIIDCSIGNRLAVYGNDFYAVPGGPVFKAHPSRLKDHNWRMVYNTCTG